jgi:hypothetical protein
LSENSGHPRTGTRLRSQAPILSEIILRVIISTQSPADGAPARLRTVRDLHVRRQRRVLDKSLRESSLEESFVARDKELM